MKTLVVYYSKTGNTEKVATEIAKQLGADVDAIQDLKDRSGAKGWLEGGRDATCKNIAQIIHAIDPTNYDLVVVGTPIWAFTVTPAIRSYLLECKAKLNRVAFFSTSAGVGIEKTFKAMETISIKPEAVLALKSKFWSVKLDLAKDDNLNKIKEFCQQLTKI